jgi:hypothetical protein
VLQILPYLVVWYSFFGQTDDSAAGYPQVARQKNIWG